MSDPLDDLLDARLREEARYIDDEGFTAGVLQQLPSRPRSLQTQRSLVIMSAAILSVIVAFFASGEGMFVRDILARIVSLPPLQLLIMLVGGAMTVMFGGAWAAFSRARDSVF